MSRKRRECGPRPLYVAHLTVIDGRLAWSGHLAAGDPERHAIAHRIDVGGEFTIGEENGGRLIVPRVSRTEGFTPAGLMLAARRGMFGFRIVAEEAMAPS